MDIRHALNLAHTFLVNAENATANGFQEGKRLLDEAVTLILKGYHLGAPMKDLIQKHGAAANVPPAPVTKDSNPKELMAALALAEADKEIADGKVASLEASLQAATNQVTEQATAIATLQTQVVNLSATADGSKVKESDPTIEVLQAKNAELTSNLAEALSAISEDNQKIAEDAEKLATLQAQVEDLTAKIMDPPPSTEPSPEAEPSASPAAAAPVPEPAPGSGALDSEHGPSGGPKPPVEE